MDFENQNMETKKSGKGGIIGICVAAVIVLLAVAAALVYTFVYNTPQRKLTKAFEKLGREFAGSESSFLEELKIEDILANARKNPTGMEGSANITVPYLEENSMFDTVGIDFTSHVNRPEQKSETTFTLSVANVDFLELQTALIGDNLYMALPGLLSDTYEMNLKTIGKDYQGSVWESLLGADLDEDFSIDVYNDKEEDNASTEETLARGTQFAKEMLAVIDRHKEALRKASVYKQQKGYITVTVDKDAVNDFMEDLGRAVTDSEALNDAIDEYIDGQYAAISYLQVSEEELQEMKDDAKEEITDAIAEVFDISLKEDAVIRFSIDKSGKLTGIETEEDILLDNTGVSGIGFALNFNGEKNSTEDITGRWNVEMTTGETTECELHYTAERTKEEDVITYTLRADFTDADGEKSSGDFAFHSTFAKADKEFSVSVKIGDGSENLSLDIDGAFTDYKAGESFEITFGNILLEEDGKTVFKATGSYKIAPYDGEINTPEGTVNVFEMSQMDIYSLILELEQNLSSLTSLTK